MSKVSNKTSKQIWVIPLNYEGKNTKMRQTQVQYLRKNKRNRIENNRRSFCRDEERQKPSVLSPEYPGKRN